MHMTETAIERYFTSNECTLVGFWNMTSPFIKNFYPNKCSLPSVRNLKEQCKENGYTCLLGPDKLWSFDPSQFRVRLSFPKCFRNHQLSSDNHPKFSQNFPK